MSKFYSSFNKTNICNVIVAIWFSRNRKQIKVKEAFVFVDTYKTFRNYANIGKKLKTGTQQV